MLELLEEMNKDFNDFCDAADDFIRNFKKNYHETCTCEHCGMIIEPDERYEDVDGMPYHIGCFKEIMK